MKEEETETERARVCVCVLCVLGGVLACVCACEGLCVVKCTPSVRDDFRCMLQRLQEMLCIRCTFDDVIVR